MSGSHGIGIVNFTMTGTVKFVTTAGTEMCPGEDLMSGTGRDLGTGEQLIGIAARCCPGASIICPAVSFVQQLGRPCSYSWFAQMHCSKLVRKLNSDGKRGRKGRGCGCQKAIHGASCFAAAIGMAALVGSDNYCHCLAGFQHSALRH